MKIIVKVLIADKQDRFLILERGMTHPNFPGHFDLPGGEAETNERLSKTVIREVVEETGIDLKSITLKPIFDIRQSPKVRHVLYLCRISQINPPIRLSWEHMSYEWLTVQELKLSPRPENTDDYFLNVLENLDSINSSL